MDDLKGIINLRFTHKKVPIEILERLTFDESKKVLQDLIRLEKIEECLILQTCNRREIYAVSLSKHIVEAASDIANYWISTKNFNKEEFYLYLEISYDSEALNHLLRLASSLESMIVGEDQILGQVRKSFLEAKTSGTVGQILNIAFEKVLNTGKKIRHKTNINNGAVSIGSAAVKLIEESLGTIKEKEIMIIGASEIGTLVGKALSARKHPVIYVANRTFEKGKRLAKKFGGFAVVYDNFKKLLTSVDVVIVTTGAPHYIITKRLMESVLRERKGKNLFILDLSNPRNVEASVAILPNVEVHNIDDLRGIAELNFKLRCDEIKKGEKMVKEELKQLLLKLKSERVDSIISALTQKIEENRKEELDKALKMLGDLNQKQRNIINDLTIVLVKRILHHPITIMKKAAQKEDLDMISRAQKLFNINLIRDES